MNIFTNISAEYKLWEMPDGMIAIIDRWYGRRDIEEGIVGYARCMADAVKIVNNMEAQDSI